jgi:hypothetical protein
VPAAIDNTGFVCYSLMFCVAKFLDMKELFGMILLKEKVFILLQMDLSGLFLLHCFGMQLVLLVMLKWFWW